MVSGFLSFLTFVLTDEIDVKLPSVFGFLLVYSPGIMFAVFMALVFLKKGIPKDKAFIIAWIPFVTMAYIIAYHLVYFIDHETVFFISGTLGALIVSVVFHFFIKKIQFKEVFVIALSGGLLGLSWYLGEFEFFDNLNYPLHRIFNDPPDGVLGNIFASASYLYLFVMWQGGIAYLLGRAISKKAT